MVSNKTKQVSIIVNFKYPYIDSSQPFRDCILSSPITILYVNILTYSFYLICNINDFYNFSKVES